MDAACVRVTPISMLLLLLNVTLQSDVTLLTRIVKFAKQQIR
jgi:hypothetical protein